MTSAPPDPFFHLPDTFPNDDPRVQAGIPADTPYPQLPAVTVSCGNCERIVSDSAFFICAARQAGAVIMEGMVSVKLGEPRVTESAQGAFDQYCLYKPIHCLKCDHHLGKMYISVAAGVPMSFLQKYTVSRTQVLFYSHGIMVPSLPLAESEELLRQIHPEPDEIAINIQKIMSLLVHLKEEQDGIKRELKRVGFKCGVDIDLDSAMDVEPMDGEEKIGEGWRDRMDKLEKEMEKLRGLLDGVVKDGSLSAKALERGQTLGGSLRDGSHANSAKRRRVEKTSTEPNKRVAKSPSPARLPQKVNRPSTVPVVVVPPVQTKPVVVPPAEGKKAVIEIEDSGAEEVCGSSGGSGVESSTDSEEVEDKEEEWQAEADDDEESEEEEALPARASKKYNRAAPAGAQEMKEAVQIKNGRERDKDKERAKEKEIASRTTRASLPLSKSGLGARRRTTGGR